MSGETQLRRNLKVDVEKVKSKLGKGTGKVINIILHDFNPGSEWSGYQPPDVITADGTRIHVDLRPYKPEEKEESQS